ncbi:aldehyde dehydrogenase family protein [Hoeflea prorocentri]|uniref:Aldehyde dehydrogenase family protein n=1 Tax=Hoeflea prorocentri TaxID=1922333 RepID=A0A9X3UI66_9HYPH|nr:aldehyde dehydrogenase family protein [Hoeflea prorocentri]MCY6379654.1 aldehyde dehydrogenase family protein [Hoeflea prorocentri]MDA5397454.1 aldehyde dehydrogenase family protein [Hoeflea prorocentri]
MNVQVNPAEMKIDFGGPYVMSIGGKLVGSNETFEVYNPATGGVVANAPAGTREQMEEAIAAAKAAQPAWAALSFKERGAYIEAYADALEANKEDIITLLTTEQGKPRHSMATVEVDAAIYWVREVAKRELKNEVIEDTEDHVVEVAHTPLGVVGAITPWNFPILLGLWKIAPCLLTGNTMVMKPSPYTPLGTLRFGEIAQQIFPEGVLNIVSGGNEQGQWMTEHPDISKISFTGSTATGKKVMASSASNLKRITLELGGNDPAILLPETDYEPLIPVLFDAAYGNAGQWCIATKRLYVHSSQQKQFVDAFVAYASTKTVGDGMDPNTDIGPIQNTMQYNKLRSLFADTKDKGYNIRLGGEIDESLDGNFVPITVVDNPPEDSRVVQEEPFGPILPIIAYDDVDDVIEKANDTEFGLAASVWGPDRDEAIEVGKQIEAGTVWVNEIHIHGIDIPFGGHKQSGMGVENGREGLEEFTNTKTYMFKK